MSRRILLADDSVTIQKVIELTFMDGDYELRAVSSGDEAIAILGSVDPDLVIADVHMPGATGYEVARRSKALRPAVPVLLLVGTFEPFDEAEARASGANRHLKKPFDSQELLEITEELLMGGAQAPAPEEFAAPAPAAFAPPAFEVPPAIPAAADAGFSFSSFESAEPAVAAAPSAPAAAEPIWSNFELEPDDTALPPLDESDLGLRVDPEPVFELSVDEEPAPAFAPGFAVTEPEPAPIFAAEPIAPTPTFAAPSAPMAAMAPIAPMAPTAAITAPAAGFTLSDEDVDRIARRVVELLGDKPVRDVAWEVVPDLAEVVIRDRIRELEAAADA